MSRYISWNSTFLKSSGGSFSLQKWIFKRIHSMNSARSHLWYAFGLRHFNEFHIYCILASKNAPPKSLAHLECNLDGLHKVITTKYEHHRYGLVWQLRIPSPPRWLHAAAFAAVESSAERPSRRGAQCNKHYMHCTRHRLSQASESLSQGEKHLPSWGLSKNDVKSHQRTVMIVAIMHQVAECSFGIYFHARLWHAVCMVTCEKTFKICGTLDTPIAPLFPWPRLHEHLSPEGCSKDDNEQTHSVWKFGDYENAIPNIETNQKMQESDLREPRTIPCWAAHHGATFYFRSAWS